MSTRCKKEENIRPTAEKFYIHLKIKTGKGENVKEWLLHKVPVCELFMVLPLKLLTLESISKSTANQSHPRVQPIHSHSEPAGIFPLFSHLVLYIIFLDVEKGRRELSFLICLLLRTGFLKTLINPMVQTSHPYQLFVIFSFKNFLLWKHLNYVPGRHYNKLLCTQPLSVPLPTCGWSYFMYLSTRSPLP